ncbi:MAG: L-seryl-tRNA(Sec) selenium transferase [Nitrospirae bacterium]|nr:L-seryl-tRNA(Sec) selenium transferase [Nitrospirota bacterium]MCL5420885.1 L-seryl-tRNA(Sec) selenium transferase [Nitrospirota bacterium]
MNRKQELLSHLPSVDEVLKSGYGSEWLGTYPRRYVLAAIREGIDLRRKEILEGTTADVSVESMVPDITARVEKLSSLSLRPVINATGIVIHTNLGRSVLSEKAVENMTRIATQYSNLEFDLGTGKRGKRYSHIKKLLREITGAEDGFAVNNNAAAVLLCLSALAKGREVIVSRGELVEIGGSFRVPDVMAQSGAALKEVGTTNKTHLHDYERAMNDSTALILKVHQSNYRITGFTEDVSIEKLAAFGHGRNIPVMHDLGSGCLINLKPYGIHTEPSVQEILKSGVDIVTFSGDKLLGGPQAGLILGRKECIEKIQKHPLTRAVRIDKLTLAALEATLLEYADEEHAKENIPTVKMLLEDPEKIRARAKKIAVLLRRDLKDAAIEIIKDSSQAGGGSLPEVNFPTFAVSIKPGKITVNELEERLRSGRPSIVARIKGDSLILDPRTISTEEVEAVVKGVRAALR